MALVRENWCMDNKLPEEGSDQLLFLFGKLQCAFAAARIAATDDSTISATPA
jgi:hypothetical protein